MVIGEAVRTTLEEVWGHKLRSGLTLVGVVLGTMAVVFMVSLIEAVKVEVWRGVQTLGLNEVMFVSASEPRTTLDGKRAHLSAGLRRQDAERVAAATDLITAAAPVAFSQQVLAWGDRSQSVRLYGTTPAYATVLNRSVEKGRYLSDYDLVRKRRVVVIGYELDKQLFGGREAVGQWVRIGDHRFEVVGVGANMGNSFVQSGFSRREMEGATIPLTTLQNLFAEDDRVPLMAVKVAGTDGLSGIFAFLKNRLWRQHNRVEDFEVENVAAEIVEAEVEIDDQMRGWTIVLFSISAISLVVGGVGIFSVLQISLAERLYEIGLRKSIGAEDRDILVQFLVEAVFLSILGAAIGLGLALILCAALGSNFDAGVPVSGFAVGLAVLFAIGIGLVAGFYPALRASRMTPVEALRG
jgi:putative ABC transport system permease protein